MRSIAMMTALMLSLSGCTVYHAPVMNTTNISDIDFGNIQNFKRGESCQKLLLGSILIGKDEASLYGAIKNGGLNKVYITEYKVYAGLLIIKDCVVVYGE